MASLRDQVRVGEVFDRENFLQFVGLLRQAEGEELGELTPIVEAFSVLANSPEEIIWMGEALAHAEDGMPLEEVRQQADAAAAAYQESDGSREDAAEADGEEAIDWERVNREAQSIVELNQAARQRWKEQQGQDESQED